MTTQLVPRPAEIATLTRAGTANREAALLAMREKQDSECVAKMIEAAQHGYSNAKCDPWMTDKFREHLTALKYDVKFVDTLADGEGGRLSSLDVSQLPYWSVAWNNKTS
jgi:hypothetical protein